jgi:hypothetical protein
MEKVLITEQTKAHTTEYGPRVFGRNKGIHRYMQTGLLVKITGSEEPFVTSRDLAHKLKVQQRVIQDWHRRYSDFPAVALPGSLRIRLSEFAAWLEQFQKQHPEA